MKGMAAYGQGKEFDTVAALVRDEFPSRVRLENGKVYDRVRFAATATHIYVWQLAGNAIQLLHTAPYSSIQQPTYQNRYTWYGTGEGAVGVMRGSGCGCGNKLRSTNAHQLLSAAGVA